MKKLKRLLYLCLLAGLAAGCATTGIEEYEGPVGLSEMEAIWVDSDRLEEE